VPQLLEELTQFYWNYDKSVVDLFHNSIRYPPNESGEPLLCVFATPERAFAQVWKRLGETSKQKTHPLLFASIDRVGEDFDTTRERNASLRRFAHTWDPHKGQEKWYSMQWPEPIKFTYQVTFWSRELRDLDSVVQQLHKVFSSPGFGKYVSVDHPFPMNERLVWTSVREVKRLPVVEDPNKQRTLRLAVTLVMLGWLVVEPQEHGIVEKIVADFHDSPDLVVPGPLLDTVEVIG